MGGGGGRGPGFVRDARVSGVSRQGDGGSLPRACLLALHSKMEGAQNPPRGQPLSSPSQNSRLRSWYLSVHQYVLREDSNLLEGVSGLHHPLPPTPAAQVPLGPS